jgi:hypothetical protein
MKSVILTILFIPIAHYSYSQIRIDSLKTVKQDTLHVWPLPKNAPPPPVNMAKKKVRCYGKNAKGITCTNFTTSITGLCKKHEPKFSPPIIMKDIGD